MFHNKQALIGLYAGSTSPTPTSIVLTGFSVTTTSGNISVDWGDGTSESINSGVLVNHTFFCQYFPAPLSTFWNNITPCV